MLSLFLSIVKDGRTSNVRSVPLSVIGSIYSFVISYNPSLLLIFLFFIRPLPLSLDTPPFPTSKFTLLVSSGEVLKL